MNFKLVLVSWRLGDLMSCVTELNGIFNVSHFNCIFYMFNIQRSNVPTFHVSRSKFRVKKEKKEGIKTAYCLFYFHVYLPSRFLHKLELNRRRMSSLYIFVYYYSNLSQFTKLMNRETADASRQRIDST